MASQPMYCQIISSLPSQQDKNDEKKEKKNKKANTIKDASQRGAFTRREGFLYRQ